MFGIKFSRKIIGSILLLLVILLIGTAFYSQNEHWSWLDSLYFSVTTLATVGYGDLHPTNPISKIFTIFYIFLGVGLVVLVLGIFARSIQIRMDRRLKQMEQLLKLIEEEEEG